MLSLHTPIHVHSVDCILLEHTLHSSFYQIWTSPRLYHQVSLGILLSLTNSI